MLLYECFLCCAFVKYLIMDKCIHTSVAFVYNSCCKNKNRSFNYVPSYWDFVGFELLQ